jgi:hypothetical protein
MPAHKLPRGDTRRSRQARRRHRPAAVLVALAALAGLSTGCGESSGVGSGATVTVYVAEALCMEAKRELAKQGGKAGDLQVRAICLPRSEKGGKLKLAVIGANARRATEDSSTVGYIGEPTKAATRFATPILEAADIPALQQTSGAAAMAKLLQALEQASGRSGSLRQSVYDELE